jgi:predicted PurR-regulated permease PerM
MEIRSISASAALRAAVTALGVIIALRFLWLAHAIFIVTFLGVLLGLALSPAVTWVTRFHLGRGVAAALVMAALVAVLSGVGFLIAPAIRDQTVQLTRELPKAMQAFDAWLNKTPAKALVDAPAQPGTPRQAGGVTAELGRELRGAGKMLFPLVSGVFGALAGVVIVFFIAMYIAAEPGLYREGVLHLVPHRHRGRAREVLATLRDTLRRWLVARLIAMVAIGVITGAGLASLHVDGAIVLGVLAGLLEFVPFFGPIASAVPAMGVALIQSPEKALWVAGLYLVVQQIEGNVLTPLLLRQRLDIPPVLTVVTTAALGVVFGVIGMLIAEPLLATILVTTKMLYVNDVVGDEISAGRGAT